MAAAYMDVNGRDPSGLNVLGTKARTWKEFFWRPNKDWGKPGYDADKGLAESVHEGIEYAVNEDLFADEEFRKSFKLHFDAANDAYGGMTLAAGAIPWMGLAAYTFDPAFLLEEAGDYAFEAATGINLYISPTDCIKGGSKFLYRQAKDKIGDYARRRARKAIASDIISGGGATLASTQKINVTEIVSSPMAKLIQRSGKGRIGGIVLENLNKGYARTQNLIAGVYRAGGKTISLDRTAIRFSKMARKLGTKRALYRTTYHDAFHRSFNPINMFLNKVAGRSYQSLNRLYNNKAYNMAVEGMADFGGTIRGDLRFYTGW